MAASSLLAVLVFAGSLLASGQTAVTTYHYDDNRTGWNQNESVLTPANVKSKTFGHLETVKLDDQVDAQPLVVPGVLITAGPYQGTHDVVYVVTENNTVYAVDVQTGTVLLKPNFGKPEPSPLGCTNNGPNVRDQLDAGNRFEQQHAVRDDLHAGSERPRLSSSRARSRKSRGQGDSGDGDGVAHAQ